MRVTLACTKDDAGIPTADVAVRLAPQLPRAGGFVEGRIVAPRHTPFGDVLVLASDLVRLGATSVVLEQRPRDGGRQATWAIEHESVRDVAAGGRVLPPPVHRAGLHGTANDVLLDLPEIDETGDR